MEVDLEQELQIKSNLERVKVFRAIKVGRCRLKPAETRVESAVLS
jgi:hypothetical protein